MWVFPVAFLSLIALPPWSGLLVILPLTGACYWIAGAPYRQRLVTWPQMMFWAVAVPFLIWTMLVAGILGLAALTR